MAEGASPTPGRPRGASIKSETAFRTIGEVAKATGVAAHVLRYWETRFPQLSPVTRAGGRRYYRPADVALVERIDRLLHKEGYTIRGVQLVLGASGPGVGATPSAGLDAVRAVRDALYAALADDE